ncbi:urease accessory protein UreF [Sphaerotilaceae bacterium SBD11-9]
MRSRPLSRQTPPLPPGTLLQLMWLASPALPVGGFSYSEGLESAVEAGLVTDELRARDWLLDQLHLGLARSELAVGYRAMQAWQRHDAATVAELNHWMLVTRESSEMRLQTEQMGRSLVEWLKNRAGAETIDERIATLAALRPAPTWPVAYALAAAQTGAPPREALLAFAFGWAENMVQAALKAVPLGQNAGQRVLAALSDAIPIAVEDAMRLTDSERRAHAPMLGILSAQHEVQYSRLFRS